MGAAAGAEAGSGDGAEYAPTDSARAQTPRSRVFSPGMPESTTRSPRSRAAAVGLVVLLLTLGLPLVGCASSSEPASAVDGGPAAGLRRQLDAADEAFNARSYDQALEIYKAVYIAARSRDMRAFECESSAQIATTYASLQDEAGAPRTAEGDPWMERAEDKANQSDRLAWSRLLLARGMRFYQSGEVQASGATFKALYNFCILNAQTPRAIQAATLASLTSIGIDQLDWSQRAIDAARTTGELGWESDLWANHAWMLDKREQYDGALEAFDRSRDLATRAAVSRLRRLQTDWAYGHGLRMVGRLEDARDLLDRTNAIAHSIYVQKPSPRAAEYLGRVLWEIGEIDAAEGSTARARERYVAAREKLVEAGAIEGAPRLVRQLDKRIAALDEPESSRRIPTKQQEKRAVRDRRNG